MFKNYIQSFKFSILFFVIFTLTLFFIKYLVQSYLFEKNVLYEKNTLSAIQYTISSTLDQPIDDIKVLGNLPMTKLYIKNNINKSLIEKTFTTITSKKRKYYQLRIIDIDGNEILKILRDRHTGIVTILPKNKLQNKSNSFYFKKGIELDQDKFYITRLDLNKEYGKIEKPLHPTIRFVSPIHSFDGKTKLGLVVINYEASFIFDQIDSFRKSLLGNVSLVNKDGYYLYSTKVKSEEKFWGFEYDNRSKQTLKTLDPERWLSTKRSDEGIHETKDYIFVHKTLEIKDTSSHVNVFWKLISKIEKKDLRSNYKSIQTIFFYSFITIIFLSIFLGNLIQKNRKSKEIIKENAIRISNIYNSSPLVILTLNSDSVIKNYNDKVETVFELAKVDIIGLSLQKVIPDLYYHLVDIGIFDDVKEAENKLETVKIKDRYFDLLFSTWEYKEKNTTLFLKDITKQKKLEDDLKEQQIKNIQSSKLASIGEIAAGIAHEINNPLAIISGYTSQLEKIFKSEKEVSDDIFEKCFTNIKLATEKTTKIVKGLKDFSRDDSEDDMQEVNLKNLVEDTLLLCNKKIINAQIKLSVDQIKDDIRFYCWPVQINQVILNLVHNAIDELLFTKEKSIHIETKVDDRFIFISVSDSGRGISEDIKHKILQPFFTTKAIGKGTGLGLSISNQIAGKHGGDLSFESLEKGTKFTLKLRYQKKLAI